MTDPPVGGRRRALALLRALTLYWLVIYPRTRRELRHWERRAQAIADPALRRHALAKLRDERLVLEGAAAFAILAAPRHRTDVMRACVTFEAVYELADVLGEQPVDDALAHNRAVNRALSAAVAPMTPHEAYTRCLSAQEPDYLHEMIDACRTAIARLPEHRAILLRVQRLADLAAEAQTLNHVEGGRRGCRFERWADSLGVADAAWWEVAAAASSPLGIYALFAAASRRDTDERTAAAIDAAYFPWIGALVWLMESLVDQREDASSGDHNYVAHYGSPQAAAARFAVLSERAAADAQALRHGTTHGLLLTGVAGMYLSGPEAEHEHVREAASAIRRALGWPVSALLVVLRLRRGRAPLRLGEGPRARD